MHHSRIPAALLALTLLGGCADAVAPPADAGGAAPQPALHTGYIVFQGRPLEIQYRVQDGLAVWSGDLVAGPADQVARTRDELLRRMERGTDGPAFSHGTSTVQWPGGRIPYVIYGSVSNPQAVLQGMSQIEQQTGVDFVPRTTETTYLEVVENSACSGLYNFASRVMYMAPAACAASTKSLAMHELGHALGLWHEHQRCDRDSYITLYWGNIDADGVRDQYTKLCGATFGSAYDFNSIMHYGSNDWWTDPHFVRKNGTVVPGFFGRTTLSSVDASTIRGIYGTSAFTAIIVDSNNANNNSARARMEVSGNWQGSSGTPGYYGSGYWFASTAAISDAAEFWFYLPSAGARTIDGWWTAGSNRAPSAPFIAYNASGAEVGRVNVNQQVNGSAWRTLGTWNFSAGWNRVVLSRWTTSGYVVIADAIRVR